MVPLEPAFLWKTVQNKELLFMDKELINEHLSRGAAVLLEGLDILEPAINAFAAKLDVSLPCALTNCVAFFSQRGNEAYEGHCDVDDVLVIQLEGEKRWRIFETQQRRYVDNGSLSKERMGRQLSEVVMRPGDGLYLRAGVPHVCQTTADYSLHISFELGDRTPNPKLITQEANSRYDKACAEQYAPAASVVDTYVALLKSEKFQSDLALATTRVKNEAITFRRRIGNASVIRALNKFAQKKQQ